MRTDLNIPEGTSDLDAGIAGDMSNEAKIVETARKSVFWANGRPGLRV